MSDTNMVVIMGRLTRDAELKYITSGTALLTASIANNQGYSKDGEWKDQVSFFEIVMWGKRAESLSQYLLKGTKIVIEGQLKQDRWENDGQARSKVKITVNNLSFAGNKKDGGGGQKAQEPAQELAQEQEPEPMQGSSENDFKDDIPF